MGQDPHTLVQDLTRGAYDLLGELGGEDGQTSVYLAREATTGQIVALELQNLIGTGEPKVRVARTLDASVPAGTGLVCPHCEAALEGWSRFCGQCGRDCDGSGAPRGAASRGREVKPGETARTAAGGTYEILGDMPRSEGGDRVVFARDSTTGRVVALGRGAEPSRASPSDPPQFAVSTLIRAVARPKPIQPLHEGSTGSSSDAKQATAPQWPQSGPGNLSAQSVVGPQMICPSCGGEFEYGARFCPTDGAVLRPAGRGNDVVGRTIAANYRVLRLIGRGGMGEVYLAEHLLMERPCALKLIRPALSQDADALTRFGREAKSAALIQHQNVAAVYDFGETDDRLIYLVMEYVDGQSLAQMIEQEAPLLPGRAVELARQIAEALSAAHHAGVVHRDLKPDNILVTRTPSGADRVKVIDFGIAKAIGADEGGVTQTGYVVGTPRYMSPEQLTADPVDGRSDLYSLGCILFEMLTGEHAFGGPSMEVAITRRYTEPPPRPRAKNKDIPEALDAIVIRALARYPADRFQSAHEMARALAFADQGVMIRTRPRAAVIASVLVATMVSGYVGYELVAGSDPVVPTAVLSPPPPPPTARSADRAGSQEDQASYGDASEEAAVVITDPAAVRLADDPSPLAQAAGSSTARVNIQGDLPPGVTVRVNGNETVIRDRAIVVPAGTSTIEVEAPEHETSTFGVDLAAGAQITWRPQLTPTPAPRLPAALSFSDVAKGELERLARALETRRISVIRSGFPALATGLAEEWRPAIEREGDSMVVAQVRILSEEEPNVRFLLRLTDGETGADLLLSTYYADFFKTTEGWRLINVRRR